MNDNRDKEHCEAVARTEATAQVPLTLTRRQLLKAGFSGVGVGSALLADTLLTPKAARSVPVTLRSFHFNVVTVNAKGQVVSRQPGTAKFFTESLGQGVGLDMVSLPGGSFVMGSPTSEAGRNEPAPRQNPQPNRDETPHRVTCKPFFMGKYAVTQAQWHAVAALPKRKHDLDRHVWFTGARRPLDLVAWDEAVEFCARLSHKTGRQYRLPSEAEWEYACRAGTTTPFHFGETITTDCANYCGTEQEEYTVFPSLSEPPAPTKKLQVAAPPTDLKDSAVLVSEGRTYPGSYGQGPQGVFRAQTTDVGSFPPNAFGLYDMHGNVWEWCADHWHDNYQGAPTDGSAWVTGGKADRRVLRGGSLSSDPRYCRSAARSYVEGFDFDAFGFRVVCALA